MKRSPERREWNPFPAFTDFILSFTASSLLFPGPELSLVCQPHGADVCIPFPASIPPVIPQTRSPCLSLHVLRTPLGPPDFFPVPHVYPLTAHLATARGKSALERFILGREVPLHRVTAPSPTRTCQQQQKLTEKVVVTSDLLHLTESAIIYFLCKMTFDLE